MNIPSHMYKDAVADTIVRKGYMPSLNMAYQIIDKFKDSFNFCLGNNVSIDDCADDINYEWINHCRQPVTITKINPFDKRVCKKVVKL